MPDEPINVIREDHGNPNLLFLGTEFAVYVSIDGGKNWTKMKTNMPTQPVGDLEFAKNASILQDHWYNK